MNKKLAIILLATTFILGLFLGCANKADIEKTKEALMQTDLDFSKISEERGIVDAFGAFMDENAMMYPNRQLPIKGREAILKFMGEGPPATLTWKPYYADVATSGDLGYTLGFATWTTKDSLGNDVKSYSKYVTIWKKQSDGSWKYVFDTGNSAPPPEGQ